MSTDLHFVCLSDIQRKDISWLWRPYIPRGALTVLFGSGGTGKSTLACAIAADLSAGRQLPGMETKSPPVRVLMASVEDDPARVIIARMETLGANLGNIFVSDEAFKLDRVGIARLARQIVEYQAAILFLDPLVSYLGGQIDMDKSNQARSMMGPLAAVAAETDTAIVVVHHSGKSGHQTPQHRALGSVDIINSARSALEVTNGQDGERYMTQVKSNWAKLGPVISFHADGGGFFEWGEFHESAPRKRPGRQGEILERAKEFIFDFLRDGPQPAMDILAAARKVGISARTLERAKAGLAHSVQARGNWVWELDDSTGMHDPIVAEILARRAANLAQTPPVEPPARPSVPVEALQAALNGAKEPPTPALSPAEAAALSEIDVLLREARARAAKKGARHG